MNDKGTGQDGGVNYREVPSVTYYCYLPYLALAKEDGGAEERTTSKFPANDAIPF